eukprot:597103_1
MGVCCSQPRNAATRTIDEKNRKSWDRARETKRLLLLGAGESGKSTLYKQILHLYSDGFTQEERNEYKRPIIGLILANMRTLVEWSDRLPEDECRIAAGAASAKQFLLESRENALTPEVVKNLHTLWDDAGIRQTYERRAQFQVPDNADYFFDKIDDLADPGKVPTYEDLLRSRVRTSGMVEVCFSIENCRFSVIDVGGQRNERSKWIHCFEDITGVIFVVALSGYNQTLFEDSVTNRMIEALNLFEEIVNSRWFKDSSVVLFLNKRDLFEEKIKTIPLTEWEPTYSGPEGDAKAAIAYIRAEFEARNQNPKKEIYTHVCCALDTDLVDLVFRSVKDFLIRNALQNLQMR